MKTVIIKKITVLLAICLVAGVASAKDVFIRQNASGNGESWENAANISYLGGSSIADGDVIHVAAGDYLRTTQISISKYVTVLGGYNVTSNIVSMMIKHQESDQPGNPAVAVSKRMNA